ncbi:MAG: hypothetical protein CVV27_07095 [Candidatus Melainabacteria bacterium HGW-Melainabacteria-1]|nr:MAG: hypothetical protein CVV27_07095 [Candidatus Melainabacteria bacterium HGW-Melainabacteria-1]
MALEDRLLGNFHRLQPEQRQLIVEFSELLLKQASRPQVEQAKVQEQVLSESERQRRLALVDEISALANPAAPPTSNREHDRYLYGDA